MLAEVKPGGVGGTSTLLQTGRRAIAKIRDTARLGTEFAQAARQGIQLKPGGVGGRIDMNA